MFDRELSWHVFIDSVSEQFYLGQSLTSGGVRSHTVVLSWTVFDLWRSQFTYCCRPEGAETLPTGCYVKHDVSPESHTIISNPNTFLFSLQTSKLNKGSKRSFLSWVFHVWFSVFFFSGELVYGDLVMLLNVWREGLWTCIESDVRVGDVAMGPWVTSKEWVGSWETGIQNIVETGEARLQNDVGAGKTSIEWYGCSEDVYRMIWELGCSSTEWYGW